MTTRRVISIIQVTEVMFFDEIYKKHYHELRRFGRQLNMPAEKSEDLTQETFLKFYVELKKSVVFENPRAWLYKVYLNMFRTSCQREKIFSAEADQTTKISEPSADLNDEFQRNEKQRIVFEVLEKLDEREKEILLLYNKGLSYSEIAEVLGMNPNSIGKTLVRAIEKLKENLKISYHELFEQS